MKALKDSAHVKALLSLGMPYWLLTGSATVLSVTSVLNPLWSSSYRISDIAMLLAFLAMLHSVLRKRGNPSSYSKYVPWETFVGVIISLVLLISGLYGRIGELSAKIDIILGILGRSI